MRYLAFVWPWLCLLQAAHAQQQPNILLIVSDDHTMQTMGAYGARYGASPHLDTLAAEGMVMDRAFVTNSICAPSRAVILTGKYSHINGHRDNLSRFDATQDHFARHLSRAGYRTAWIGKWHLEANPQGFDYWKVLPGQGHYYNPDFINMDGTRESLQGYCTDLITNLATDWLRQQPADKPFCLVVGHKATHRTWLPDLQDLGAFDQVNFALPSHFYDAYQGRKAAQVQDMSIEKTLRLGYDLKMMDSTDKKSGFYTRLSDGQRNRLFAYYDSIQLHFSRQRHTGRALIEWKFQRYMRDYLSTALSLDRNIGRLINYLRQKGVLDNTLVIYMSDQGFYMGEHGWFDKRFMYEESMRTPMIVRYPPMVKAGSRSPSLVQNLDIAPTFLALAGVTPPADMQGLSFLPILANPAATTKEAVYYHYYEYPGEHHVYRHFGIRNARYKLIRFYNAAHFWELYDLQNDPKEMNNLAGQPQYTDLLKNMQAQLMEKVKEVKDAEALAILMAVDP